MTMRLRVFGGLSVTKHGAALSGAASQRRSLTLLAALAVHGNHGVSREKLAGLFWPESDEESARNSLKQAVYVARRALGADVVLGTTDLRLGVDAMSCDLTDFEQAVACKDREQAVALYAGPFLDGIHLTGDTEEFERWVDAERSRLARRCNDVLESLAADAVAIGEHCVALRWWRRLSEVTPLDSRYAVRIVQALLAVGDRAGALQHVESHRMLLRDELGLPMSAELEGLVASARVAPVTVEAAVPFTPAIGGRPREIDSPATTNALMAVQHASPVSTSAPVSVVASGSRWRRIGVPSAVAVVVIAAAFTWRTLSSAEMPLDARRVAVIATNRAGDERTPVERSSLLVETIARRLAAIGVVAPVVATLGAGEDVQAAAMRSGTRYVIAVSAESARGDTVAVSLTDATSGERTWGARLSAATQALADSVAERCATALAVRTDPNMLNWIQASSEPSSYDGYQELTTGVTYFANNQFAKAAVHFQNAARDSGFTMGLVLSLWSNHYLGRRLTADSIAQALQSRRLPPLERALLDLQLAAAAGNLDVQYQAGLAVAAAAPQSEWRYLLAQSALDVGRATESVRVMDEMGPDLGWLRGSYRYWILLDRGLHYLGDFDRELSSATEARRRFPTNRILAQPYIKALAANGMVDSIDAEIARALAMRQRTNANELQTMMQAIVELRAHGNAAASKRVAARSLAWMRQQPDSVQRPLAVFVPMVHYFAGETEIARTLLQRSLDTTSAKHWDFGDASLLAVIHAEQGRPSQARRIDSVLASIGTSLFEPERLVSRAAIAASLGDGDAAVRLLQDAFRGGFTWRSILHVEAGFDKLRGYAPYEALVRPH